MNKAIFLDRDGTLIKDVGYLQSEERIEFIGKVPYVLKAMRDQGYLLIVISNQSGVARGFFDEEKVNSINRKINDMLEEMYEFRIDAFYFCPHHPEAINERYKLSCNCRKPKSGMVLQAIHHFDIDISKSIMIGDKESDRIDLDGLRFFKVEKDVDWTESFRQKVEISHCSIGASL